MSDRTNFCYFEGRLVGCETRPVGKGTVSSIRMRLPNGKKNDKPVSAFINVEAWDLSPAFIDELSLEANKGFRILVQGSIFQDEWVNKEGQKRSRMYIRSKQVHILGPATKEEDAPKTQNKQSRPTQKPQVQDNEEVDEDSTPF